MPEAVMSPNMLPNRGRNPALDTLGADPFRERRAT
jgi:hypothetical protein